MVLWSSGMVLLHADYTLDVFDLRCELRLSVIFALGFRVRNCFSLIRNGTNTVVS